MKAEVDFSGFSREDLESHIKNLRKSLQEARFKAVLGYLPNPLSKRTLRRQIAKSLTYFNKTYKKV